MKENEMKKTAKYGVLLIIFTFILYRFDQVAVIFAKVIDLLFPFIFGGILALFINVPARGINKLLKKISKDKMGKRLAWVISVIIAFLLIILILVIVFGSVIPDVSSSLITAFEELPDTLTNINESIEGIEARNFKVDREILEKLEEFLASSSKQILDWLKNTSGSIFSLSVKLVSDAVFGLINTFLALIFSIYLLLFKDTLKRQLKKMLFAFLSEEKAKVTILFGKRLSKNFSNFLSGIGIEAVIYGVLSFIIMKILRLPYAASISMINSLVAFIPYFGAFFGILIGFILIVTQSFRQALIFILSIIILQQIEGNLIYPKVVGDRVGLPSIWVMVSVALAGALFGIIGMIFAVPIMTFIYTGLRDIVNYRLAIKSGENIQLSKFISQVDGSEDLDTYGDN